MAQKTKEELKTDIASKIKDNGGNDPSKTKGGDLRGLQVDIVDSFLAQGDSAGGELSGTYPNPTLSQSAVVGKALTGLPAFTNEQIVAEDTILQSLAKLQGQLNGLQGVGRVLFVSKAGNDSTAVVGRQDRSFLTIQAAITNATSDGDIIVVWNGVYTENVVIPNANRRRHIFLLNATINGTVTNALINSVNFGTVTGLGSSAITGAFTVQGASYWEKVTNIKFNVLPQINGIDKKNVFDNCVFDVSSAGSIVGKHYNCFFKSTTDLITTYGAGLGFDFNNCEFDIAGNFCPATGGLASGGTPEFVFNSSKVKCANFISTRAGKVVLKNTEVKSTSNSFFLYGDSSFLLLAYASGCLFDTACTNVNQGGTNTGSIFDYIGNKDVSGTFAGNRTIVPSFSL